MPIPFVNFANMPLIRRPTNETFGNLLENALAGYQGGQQFKEEQRKRVLSNEEQALKNAIDKEYSAEKARLENEKLKAEIDPRVLAARLFLLQSQGLGAYNPEMDKADIELKQAHAKHYNEAASARNQSGIPASVRASEYNASLANNQRVFLDPIMQHPYQGTGSTLKLGNDIARYHMTKDPEIRSKLVKAAVANKLVPEFAGFQLIGQKVRPTVHALSLQEKAIRQGWAEKFDKFMNNLPKDIQDEANKVHSEILRKSSEIQSSGFENLNPGIPKRNISDIQTPFEEKGYPSGATPDLNKPGHVLMRHKNGRDIISVPKDNVEDALEAGASYNIGS